MATSSSARGARATLSCAPAANPGVSINSTAHHIIIRLRTCHLWSHSFVLPFSPTSSDSSSDTSGPYHQMHMPRAPQTDSAQPPIYLLDTMAFIFRAYHAMQRSRPMCTRTGIPTAATYVFVNMLNKLRNDFNLEYLAAVYDVGAPVHRDALAQQLKDVKKFNIKTQQFETTEYGGYKANRVETPPDLIQQQP